MKLSEKIHNEMQSMNVDENNLIPVTREWFVNLQSAVLDLESELELSRSSNIAGAFARDRFYEALCLVLLRLDEPVTIPPHVFREFKGTSNYLIEANTDLVSGGQTISLREVKQNVGKKGSKSHA
jgi:hypothetical protein